jgi:hypothetical protein
VETPVPMTMPAIPKGLYRAIDTPRLTLRFRPASAVVIHGLWRLKKVRVSSRFTPLKGSENENQKSAVDTDSVEDGPKLPCW